MAPSVEYEPLIPKYLGRVLSGEATPVGTCFHIGGGVFVTAFHVLDDLGSGSIGSVVTLDHLSPGSANFEAIVAWVDPENDLATLTSNSKSSASIVGFVLSGQVAATEVVYVAGVSDVEDGDRSYRFLQTTGSWQGGVVREGRKPVALGRMRCQDLMPGMSGAPVRLRDSDLVIGVISGRYNSGDGWLRDTVWVAPTEPLYRCHYKSFLRLSAFLSREKLDAHYVEESPEQLFARIFHALRTASASDDLDEDPRALTNKLLERLNHRLSIGDVGPGSSTRIRTIVESADLIVDDVIRKYPDSLDLLVPRSRLREQTGHWPGALDDLQTVVSVGGRLHDSLRLPVGSLLMTLGNYEQAREILRHAGEWESDESARFTARQLTSWIDDYQGKHLQAASDLLALAREANEVGIRAEVIGGIEHRIGRALFASVNLQAVKLDKQRLGLAFRFVERGREKIGEHNPFGALWLAVISRYLDEGVSIPYWHEAKEGLADLGLAGQAHTLVSEADRAVSAGDVRNARQSLWDGLTLWHDLGYPNGVYDSSLALSRLYLRYFFYTPGDRRMALFVARLCSSLATLMGSAARDEANSLVKEALDHIGRGREMATLAAVDDQIQQAYGSLLVPRRFAVP